MAPSELSDYLDGEKSTEPTASGDGARGRPARREDAPILVEERFRIYPDQPLPDLDSATATAFAARDMRDPNAELVGYVCQGGPPPRWDVVGSLRGTDAAGLLRLVSYGVIDWPPARGERPAVVFDRPKGARLVKSLRQKRTPASEEQIARLVISPVTQALTELKLRRVFHGLINPTNLWLREVDEAGGARAVLGECVTAPAGFCQPVTFETIERGMASARGAGSMADDLYAFGVTILYLMLGQMPAGHLDDRAVIHEKIERGSFHALIGDARLPLSVLEPVRGLLIDDPASRWTLEDLELWLSGRRLSPKQAQAPKRASRPFSFGGVDVWTTRSLAAVMAGRTADANQVAENGDLTHWLNRSLDDETMVNRVEEAMRTARAGRGGPVEERRVSRVLMALDGSAPIRYRGKAVMPGGIGDALADAFVRGGTVQELAEIIGGQLPMFWVSMQQEFRSEYVTLSTAFDHARTCLERGEMGYGIERCLYNLCSNMPCLSPVLEGHYVLDLEALMWALEEVAGRADRPERPIDRHIAAFILSRNNKINDRQLQVLGGDPQTPEYGLGLLGLLFELQRTTRVHPLPNLCGWAASLLDPAVGRFHSRTLQGKIRERLADEAASGLFKNLHDIISNPNLTRRDLSAFRSACRDYLGAAKAIARCQEKLMDQNGLAEGPGKQAAAMTGAIASAAMIVLIVIMNAG
jgi:hypothetical protein